MNAKKHWKFRTSRAEAAFNGIRRLTRLNPQGKRKIVVGQLLPTLTYGSELHTQPPEEAERLAGKMLRWICMGFKGSSRQKIEDIVGITRLEELTHRKRVRWAASVYSREEPELRPMAERILKEELGDEVVFRFLAGGGGGGPALKEGIMETGTYEEGVGQTTTGFTDGSRMEGHTAAATAENGIWLGALATVMDAEMLGIAGAWEEGYRVVASDSQAAVRRCMNLASGAERVRS